MNIKYKLIFFSVGLYFVFLSAESKAQQKDSLENCKGQYSDMESIPRQCLGQHFRDKYLQTKSRAEAGNADEMFFLAQMYLEGKGVEKDKEKAYSLVQTSAELGSHFAIKALSHKYYFGIDAKKDLVKSYAWAHIIASKGELESIKLIKELEKQLSKNQIDEAKRIAVEYESVINSHNK